MHINDRGQSRSGEVAGKAPTMFNKMALYDDDDNAKDIPASQKINEELLTRRFVVRVKQGSSSSVMFRGLATLIHTGERAHIGNIAFSSYVNQIFRGKLTDRGRMRSLFLWFYVFFFPKGEAEEKRREDLLPPFLLPLPLSSPLLHFS